MASKWTNLDALELLSYRTIGPPSQYFTLAARLKANPNVILTNAKLSTNAAVTVNVQTDPDLPYVTANGIFLFDGHATPHFPYGADVEDP